MTVELIQGILLAFALVVFLMPRLHPAPPRGRLGQAHPGRGPESHYIKEGTPTMGGLLIIWSSCIVVALAASACVDASTFAPLATLALVGALGAPTTG